MPAMAGSSTLVGSSSTKRLSLVPPPAATVAASPQAFGRGGELRLEGDVVQARPQAAERRRDEAQTGRVAALDLPCPDPSRSDASRRPRPPFT